MYKQTRTHHPCSRGKPARSAWDHIERVDIDTTTSTNDEARRWAAANPGRRAVIIAGTQTDGRGRLGRRWISPEGGAWMTIIRPGGKRPIGGGVSLAAAEAACEAIDKTLRAINATHKFSDLNIRWPNDLLLDKRKVGGVLGETVSDGTGSTLLLGIGINVNNKVENKGEKLRTPAVSLAEYAGGRIDLPRFLDLLAEHLVRAIDAWVDDGISPEQQGRIETRLADRGSRVRLEGTGGCGPIEGVLIGTDPDGALVLEIGGQRRSFMSGELSCRVMGLGVRH